MKCKPAYTRLALVAASGLALAACGSPGAPVATRGALIEDAAHNGGRAGFYFLPPLVEATPLPPTFNGGLTLTARFEGPSGLVASFALVADAAAQNYQGTLDTDGLALDPSTTYRVRVLAGDLELGFAGVRVFTSNQLAHSLATDENFEVVEGKKLKIRVYVNLCAAVACDTATACRGAASCDPATGACAPGKTVVDGWPCGDGNVCNGEETCQAGACAPGTPLDCDDHDACTADSCADGSCLHTPAVQCDDGDACTTDSCNPSTGACVFTPVVCSDGDACTDDACDPATGDCSFVPLACDDGNPCTADFCAPSGLCGATPIPGCCLTHAECNDGNACTADACSGPGGTCSSAPISGCCATDADCNDGNACTADACVTGTCTYATISGCCATDTDCNDGNACTADACVNGACTYATISGCCATDADCNDGDACTVDACSGGTCSHVPPSEARWDCARWDESTWGP